VKHCGKPAAYVVGDVAGDTWFVCEAHGDPELPDVRWIVRTTLEDWFRARAITLPSERVCHEALMEPPPSV
jgi:hypothetical protein